MSRLTFKSLIHFDFTFVCGVRKCSDFILLHVAVFHGPLIEDTVFSPLYSLTLVIDYVTIGVWTYLWAFYSVQLVYTSVSATENSKLSKKSVDEEIS